ncbi:hypothetical protein Atai01_11520 [Amycolatopsis taiwanensis]|uniref:Uncharacterized protein n=2 Tax=Amycolatopsis taiwanensis TaxID=342230 RepID=A0A9W6QVK5_9PSEU|nr:hypothetical protein Atai01_11520 [Amycolatopsis taiwanensis]
MVMRPSAYGLTTFDQAAHFLLGFNAALEFEFLGRFNERLAEEFSEGRNLMWPGLARLVISRRLEGTGRSLDELDAKEQMNLLFALVNEFLDGEMFDEEDADDPDSVVIGSAAGDRVVIEVLGRMHPEANDFWDGNWLFSPVEVVTGGFTGRVPAGLRADELRSFRDELVRAYQDFGGVARLESMEDWLSLTVTVKPSGHVEIDGVAVDRMGSKNRLALHITDLDQSHLPTVIDSLTAIEEKFPAVGKRQGG